MIRTAIVITTLFALAAGTAQAGEYVVRKVKDRHGIPIGTIEQRPDGQVVIKDRHGIRQGTIDTRPDGTAIIRDRWRIKRGTIERAR